MMIMNINNRPPVGKGEIRGNRGVGTIFRTGRMFARDSDILSIDKLTKGRDGVIRGRWEFNFVVMAGVVPRVRKLCVGHFPEVSLDQARKFAWGLHACIESGADPLTYRAKHVYDMFPGIEADEAQALSSHLVTAAAGSKEFMAQRGIMSGLTRNLLKRRVAAALAEQSGQGQEAEVTQSSAAPAPSDDASAESTATSTPAASADLTQAEDTVDLGGDAPGVSEVDGYMLTLAFERLLTVAETGQPVPKSEVNMARAVLDRSGLPQAA